MSEDSGVIILDQNGRANLGWGSSLFFKNIESFPGQLSLVPAKTSAKREQQTARTDVVKAARHVERTNEHVRGGIDRRTNMVIGSQLSVRPTPQFELLARIAGWSPEQTRTYRKEFARSCELWFYDWAYAKRCAQDAERHYNFGGMMWMAYRNLAGPDAEAVGYIGYDEARAARLKSRWATFVHILDSDRLAMDPPASLATDMTRYFQGRELDELGAMEALWVTNAHPNDEGYDPTKHIRVPRETDWGRPMAFHFFKKHRGGSQRGLSSLVTSLRASTMLDRYSDAALGSAILQEIFAFYAKSAADPETVARQLAPAGETKMSPFDYKLDYYSRTKLRFGDQRVAVMPPGDELKLETVNRAAQDTNGFVNGHLRRIAMALDLNFEQFANDYSQANYSSIRAGLLDVWRGVLSDRGMFGDHVPALIYDAVIEEAIFKGRIVLPPGAPDFYEYRDAYTACLFRGPAMGWVDPQREASAMETRLKTRMSSRTRESDNMGEDFMETLDDLETEQEEADSRGITLDVMEQAQANGAANAGKTPGATVDNPDNNPSDARNTGGQ